MRFWIDIANAPHATLFDPVAEVLTERGHEVVVTVWDRGQALPLTLTRWPDALVVGSGRGYHRALVDKSTAITRRARELQRVVTPLRPDIALGHNSYAQLLAARLMRVPAITAMDYEHQPANHLAFRLARHVMLPEAIPDAAVRQFGLRPARIVRYPGTKEEITLSRYTPDSGFRDNLGVADDQALVTLRPPAEGATYHRGSNQLFECIVDQLRSSDAHVLLSPRTRGQGDRYEARFGVRVLREPVNGRDLLYHSDMFIGAGGTMTREAAVLGTLTYSVFGGKPAAVDDYLERLGTLHRLNDARLPTIRRSRKEPWVPLAAAPVFACRLEALAMSCTRDREEMARS